MIEILTLHFVALIFPNWNFCYLAFCLGILDFLAMFVVNALSLHCVRGFIVGVNVNYKL